MKRQKRKISKSRRNNSEIISRTEQAIAAIEKVFRQTHHREMTPRERRLFALPPVNETKTPD